MVTLLFHERGIMVLADSRAIPHPPAVVHIGQWSGEREDRFSSLCAAPCWLQDQQRRAARMYLGTVDDISKFDAG